MIEKIKSSIQTTRFQQIAIFFTVFYIGTALILQYKQSYFSEKNIEPTAITKQETKLTSMVEAGLYINNFPRFSFYKNAFIMDGIVWFSFPIGNESLQTIDNFSFKNGVILSKSKPIVQMDNGKVTIRYHVVVKFSTNVNYKNFPISDHKLHIILENKSVSPQEMLLTTRLPNFDFSEDLLSGEWRATTKYVDYGYVQPRSYREVKEVQTIFPSAVFILDFKNEDLRNFILLYLPLLLLFLLIFTSLLSRVENLHVRFPIVAGVVPILALHSLVIASVSPSTSSMTKIDQLYLSLIALSLLILLFQAYVGLRVKALPHASPRSTAKKLTDLQLMNNIVILCVLTILILVITYTTVT